MFGSGGSPARTAAPGPFFGAFRSARADRVVEDVFDRRLEMLLVFDHPGGEALAEEGTSASVAGVVLARVVAVQPVKR
jgi:hypothetical protein